MPFSFFLYDLASSSDYQLVGATADHSQNHWGSANVVLAIPAIMQQFKAETGLTPEVNDMSLGWGGTFDLGPAYATANCPVWAAQYWTNVCVHAEHRTGLNVDVPKAPLGAFGPRFVQIARDFSGAGGGEILDEGNHYHLRFAY